jgi:hypothetical protein
MDENKASNLPPWMLDPMQAKAKAGGGSKKRRQSRAQQSNGRQADLPPQPDREPIPPELLARVVAYLAKCPPAISGQGGHSQTYEVSRAVCWGFNLGADAGFDVLWEHYNGRCQPPWSEKELRHKCTDADTRDFDKVRGYLRDEPLEQLRMEMPESEPEPTSSASSPPPPPPTPEPAWPSPPDAKAYYGLAGQVVRVIGPASESDGVALLVQTLLTFGNAAGRCAHFVAESSQHFPNEFAVLVGRSSKGRKGSSWSRSLGLVGEADPIWAGNCVASGLSSGEGLIWAIRDPIRVRQPVKQKGRVVRYEEVEADPGIADKRLCVFEAEFASVLRVIERQGNTLSPILRGSWDGNDLRSMTKNSPARASRPHVSLVGHITAAELRRYLSETEQCSGFANRFLWLCVDRSKKLPDGGEINRRTWEAVKSQMADALTRARSVGEVRRDDAAGTLWRAEYDRLSEGLPGLAGALLARSEAHVMRLALIYALMDGQTVIGRPHLEAALALWAYVERSVHFIFEDRLGDSVADELLALLKASPGGLTRNDLMNYLGRHQRSERIGQALGLLLKQGMAFCIHQKTGGRSAERWFAGKPST